MTEPATMTEEPTAPPAKRKYKRRKAVAKVAKLKVPEEFAGLTERDCCDACLENKVAAEAAQRRLNDIGMTYPRGVSPNRNSETVMESDAEWMARNPSVAEEFRKLSKAAMGQCAISGGMGCAHPFKGGLQSHLQRDPKSMARYQRAKKILAHRLIDLRGG